MKESFAKDIKGLELYLKGNNLKYEIIYNQRSMASHLYGTLILLLAFDSEFKLNENISSVIKKVILNSVNENMETKVFIDDFKSLEIKLNELMTQNKDMCYYKLYTLALKNGLFKPKSIMENKKYEEIFRFYYENMKLERKMRSGWDDKHWNVLGRRESISEHVYGTILLSISMSEIYEEKIDMNKVLLTLLIHEIGEILIGDITPFDNISEKEKANIEHNAMKKVLGNLSCKEEYFNCLLEFDERKTPEAKFAYLCDKFEADIQAKIYEEKGLQNSLSNQENNVVFRSEKVKQMVEDGAKTAFDIWYLWDKDKFKDSPSFKNALDYIKDNDILKEKGYILKLGKK